MDSVGLSRLKGIEKDRLKAEEQKVTTETVTAAIKQRKRVSFTILGHNNKDNVSSSSIRRVKGFSRKCKKCNGVFMKEELRNNPNSNHEPIEQRGAKRPSNALPHTCSRGSKNKHGKCDNDIDMERKKTVPMKEPIGIMRVPPRFSSSSTSSLNNNNNNNNNNNGNIGAPQHVQHAQQQQPIVRFKYSKLLKALKRSNETRGLIEKTVKKIKTDFNSSSLISSSSPASASASASAPNNCTNNNDSEEESRRRCSVRRKGCAEFTKAMMAQTLPSTMISYVENNHKRILGDNNNERKDNTTTTKNPSTTGKKKMKEDDK
ncbi:hypothetical protein FRACYDRAFT_239384 [Fragilariopsis cylindrus CCMP1102]|uniref:Uncharacterized protein n=1 Tax=Fragilariopsis cylindrus CCMP1102 TaxID=635003 RepID=A0A1E7FF40_9STRA|nr:hypothetical protein FRACYDRAFT_239384 [Fragilariopsis cylindrus CCMP1102]|eukprot:OEU16791.1 hypothetical protein FRACYDRAFT_239384 [Fragilariopsis cylindrus CCMP1102]